MKILDTPSQVLNASSKGTNTPSQCRRHQICPILIYAVLLQSNLCRKFTHFSGVQFTGQKLRWRTKNDKYEVWGSDWRYQGYWSVWGWERLMFWYLILLMDPYCAGREDSSKLKINIALLLPERTLKDAPQMDIANIAITIILIHHKLQPPWV